MGLVRWRSMSMGKLDYLQVHLIRMTIDIWISLNVPYFDKPSMSGCSTIPTQTRLSPCWKSQTGSRKAVAHLDNVEVLASWPTSRRCCKKTVLSTCPWLMKYHRLAIRVQFWLLQSSTGPEIETIYLYSRPVHLYISSSAVRTSEVWSEIQ